jgi:hypothetical protein
MDASMARLRLGQEGGKVSQFFDFSPTNSLSRRSVGEGGRLERKEKMASQIYDEFRFTLILNPRPQGEEAANRQVR